MKPVDQTRFGKPRGNCTEACVASLLEIPLEDVPDLAANEDCGPHATPKPWQMLIDEWARARFGLRFVVLPATGAWMPDVFHGMGGMAARGLRHMVVACAGEMVHDPHHSRMGLTDVDTFYFFVPDNVASHARGGR